uniref:C1q domain-containing protein n=1 Tax=Strombidium inclinatum TaxID=197538 RepID=A0A7S3IP85_9SPIT|mmetsp:Transcript_28721/g.43375  ORF Transcript_28721/g.43375 Transcript_28721/m.43375 type:complete len:100 (+) Transcript_28721:488-787(+)
MVLTVAPGLYEINFGFYCGKQPTIQVLVNGEPILSAVNNSSYVIHHSSGKLKQTGKQHSAGNLTGLTMIDFISLPARARVSVSYSGEKKCEGFLGLRKL